MRKDLRVSTSFLFLNLERVEASIAEQSLKRYWVAEQAGIHKTTLRRWLKGRIQRVRKENAEALAQVLNSEVTQIVVTAN